MAQFRAQVERRVAGALTEDEFKPLRLMNGLYLQLHAYMLRVAIPYGLLSSGQLNLDLVLNRVSPLAEWREAFEEMHSGRIVKGVLTPQ